MSVPDPPKVPAKTLIAWLVRERHEPGTMAYDLWRDPALWRAITHELLFPG